MNQLYFIVNPDGKIERESGRLNENQCKNDFVQSWLSTIPLDPHTCWNVWGCFKRAGYKCEFVEIPSLSKKVTKKGQCKSSPFIL